MYRKYEKAARYGKGVPRSLNEFKRELDQWFIGEADEQYLKSSEKESYRRRVLLERSFTEQVAKDDWVYPYLRPREKKKLTS